MSDCGFKELFLGFLPNPLSKEQFIQMEPTFICLSYMFISYYHGMLNPKGISNLVIISVTPVGDTEIERG